MKDSLVAFYLNKYKYIKNLEEADISFIPALARRRLSRLDRITAAALNLCFDEKVENIVFSSKTGEIERLLKIIEQYQTDGDASPAVFSGSVHNFAVSSFLMNKQKAIPYTALAAGENTLPSAILAAASAKYGNNLVVFSDVEDDNYYSVCLHLTKEPQKNSVKYVINSDCKAKNTSLNDFIRLFNGEIHFLDTPFYKIERDTDV